MKIYKITEASEYLELGGSAKFNQKSHHLIKIMTNKIYVSWGKKDKTGKRDECDTRLDEAEKLVKYIKNIIPVSSKIWCPFDNDHSNIVIALKEAGYNNVINTHIDEGQDFFKTEVECDYIISNPPFQNRTPIFKRLYSFDTPFIILQPIQAFNK